MHVHTRKCNRVNLHLTHLPCAEMQQSRTVITRMQHIICDTYYIRPVNYCSGVPSHTAKKYSRLPDLHWDSSGYTITPQSEIDYIDMRILEVAALNRASALP